MLAKDFLRPRNIDEPSPKSTVSTYGLDVDDSKDS